MKFEKHWKYMCCFIFALEVVFTAIDLVASSWKQSENVGPSEEAVNSELEYEFLDAIQILLGCCVIYMLVIY